MPRITKKNEATTVSQGVSIIFDTPVLKTVSEGASFVGCAEIRLLELFSNALNLPEALGWETIPQEHEHLLNEFKAQATTNTQVLPEESPQLPAQVEPPVPMIEEEEARPAKQTKRKSSSALTKTKTSKLKESDQKAQQLASSDQQVKVALHARKGQKSGAQLATIELAAEDLTYRKIKGEALLRKTAQLTSEIASESGFDPIQVLNDLGIDSNSEIFENLREQLEPALGKVESATAEIVDNAWVNGIDLGAELGNLESLLNWND